MEGSGLGMTDMAFEKTRSIDFRRVFTIALAVLLALAAAAQLTGVFQKNLHWDEFIYLKNIYRYLDNDMSRVIQTAFVHLFTWVPAVSASEIGQIVAGRSVMYAAWLVSLFLLYRLASRLIDDQETSPGAKLAAVAGVAFFALFSFSQYHAASFRADSLLLPVLLAMALLLCGATPKRLLAAGALGGLGLAISIKAVLWLPAVLGLLLIALAERPIARRQLLIATAGAAIAALAVFGCILVLHALTLAPTESAGGSGGESGGLAGLGGIFWQMFMEEGLFPRWAILRASLVQNAAIWLLVAGGVVATLRGARREAAPWRLWRLLAVASPLLLVAVYHNAWPYCYLVLMPGACLLAGYAFSSLVGDGGRLRPVLALLLLVAVALPGSMAARANLSDSQATQRQALDLIHEVFPEPVPYIDKSGFVSSFPRDVFTMTTYGLRVYREKGEAAVAAYIRDAKPPLLIVNWRVLEVWPGGVAEGHAAEDRLFPEDEEMLRRTYAPYWGPVYLAGREWESLAAGDRQEFDIVIPGTYTLLAEAPVTLDGAPLRPGESRVLSAGKQVLESATAQPRVRLLWGKGLKAPPPQPDQPLYGF